MEGSDGSLPDPNLHLDGFGQIVLTLDTDGLSWKQLASDSNELDNCCLRYRTSSKVDNEIKFSDIYAVEILNHDLFPQSIPRMGGILFHTHLKPDIHHFAVHGYRKSKDQQCLWVPSVYIFAHEELQTCQKWTLKIRECINKEVGRPKRLLVFVHPLSGRGKGRRIWESVQPIFLRANVETKVIVTQRSGHAFDLTASMANDELGSFDGIIAVGGDGFFNEILNGLLLSRHKTTIHSPNDFFPDMKAQPIEQCLSKNKVGHNGFAHLDSEDHEDVPLLPSSKNKLLMDSGIVTGKEAEPCGAGNHSVLSFPNNHFRLGLIPAGSTDSIVISTTGTRDAVTSALHIVLGKRVRLDIAQVVTWKTCNTSSNAPFVRYAASFAGYGFYGDVVKESEKYRWMGPRRYDYAGTKVFVKHSSYEADVSFLEVEYSSTSSPTGSTRSELNLEQCSIQNPYKRICRVRCNVCDEPDKPTLISDIVDSASSSDPPGSLRWMQRKGRFHCVGAAIISCRNERAPDGLVADAHLADGFLHLILIKECPRPFYLWHLTKLTRRGSNPLDFKFIEHHRTPAFTFSTSNDESIWNLDGELFQACQLSARVFRGLINLFASGPEV